MHQYTREDVAKVKEALLGVVSSFLRGPNYESKIDFLSNYNGLEFLINIISDEDSSLRLIKKALFFLYDLVINDDHIFRKEDPTFVRRNLSQNKELLMKMVKDYLLESDLDNKQTLDMREYVLRILKYVIHYKHDLLIELNPYL